MQQQELKRRGQQQVEMKRVLGPQPQRWSRRWRIKKRGSMFVIYPYPPLVRLNMQEVI